MTDPHPTDTSRTTDVTAAADAADARKPTDLDTWDTVASLHAWLTAHQTLPPGQEVLLRVLKLSEEVGETAQAVIGATGQNPRKGHSHTWEDVEAELCDVVITAMVALRTLTPDAREVFARHLRRVAVRSLPRPQGEPAPKAE
ncbi:MazG-like family protein [Streptomyces sp. NPDC048717]|uniref:MazG-like family protein n=1 Tax=Streptomyces sp. NPDC048717 TaxID=3154928 RepID=UPI0034448F21